MHAAGNFFITQAFITRTKSDFLSYGIAKQLIFWPLERQSDIPWSHGLAIKRYLTLTSDLHACRNASKCRLTGAGGPNDKRQLTERKEK